MRKLGRRRPNLLVPVAGIVTTAGGLALAVAGRRRAAEPPPSASAAPASDPTGLDALLGGDASDLPGGPRTSSTTTSTTT